MSSCYTIHLCTYTRDLYSASVSGVSQVHRRMDFRFPRVKSLVYSIIIIMIIIIIIRISLAAACAAKGLMMDKINLIAFKTQKCSIPFAHVSKLNSRYNTHRLHGKRTFSFSLFPSIYLSRKRGLLCRSQKSLRIPTFYL